MKNGKYVLLDKYYQELRNKIRKYILKGFNKPFFRLIKIKNLKFWLLIDPKNGELDEFFYIHKNKIYEPKITARIIRFLKNKDNPVFLDIGANIGYYTNLVGVLLANKGKVIAFEPLKRIYKQNKISIKKNELWNVRLYNYGVGEKNEKKEIYIGFKNVAGSSIIKEKYSLENQTYDQTEIVKIIKLDSFLKEKKIDLIKIDVEGYEYYVLKGMLSILKNRPNLILEFSSYIHERREPGLSERILDILFKFYNKIEIIETGVIYKNKERLLQDIIGKQLNLFCCN